MPRYNDFELDLQRVNVQEDTTMRTYSYEISHCFGECETVGFGCLTNADDCGDLSLSFCCQ